MENKQLKIAYLLRIIGSVLLFFIGWEYNIALMGWIALPLLIFSFWSLPKWRHTLPLIPIMVVVKLLSIHKGWDISLWMEIGFSMHLHYSRLFHYFVCDNSIRKF